MGALTRVRVAAVAAICLTIVISVAACGSGGESAGAPTAPPTPLLVDPALLCKSKVGNGVAVRFGRDSYLGGVVVGSGPTGVVLGHRNDANLCEWMPYAHELADKGYRVLAFDFAEFGSSNP